MYSFPPHFVDEETEAWKSLSVAEPGLPVPKFVFLLLPSHLGQTLRCSLLASWPSSLGLHTSGDGELSTAQGLRPHTGHLRKEALSGVFSVAGGPLENRLQFGFRLLWLGFPSIYFPRGLSTSFCLGRRAKSFLLFLSSSYLVLSPLKSHSSNTEQD